MRAASALKPVEISSERKQEGRNGERASVPPHLSSPCSAAGVFLLLFSFSLLFFRLFLMNWSSLREEGLLVSLEGEGGELVPYPSLQECEVWFENGEPCLPHPLLLVSFLHLCLQTLLPSHTTTIPPPNPFTCCSTFHSVQVCLLSDLTAVSAAGSNDACTDMGPMGGAQESNFSPCNDAFVKGLHSNDNVGLRTCESTRVR